MTVSEFFGCTFLAFGPPLAMFMFTVAHDPIRVIIMIAASFFWLLALLFSSILWFAVLPLRSFTAFGLVFSVLFQVSGSTPNTLLFNRFTTVFFDIFYRKVFASLSIKSCARPNTDYKKLQTVPALSRTNIFWRM